MDEDPEIRGHFIQLDCKLSARTYIEQRKFRQDSAKFFSERILCKFDFSHIEISNPTDFEVFVDNLGINQPQELQGEDRSLTVGVFL